jgi:putative selenium metabolism hydrolase
MDQKITTLAQRYLPLAVEILREAIRIPADYVDRPVEEGGDPLCGTSNHEAPRLEYLRNKIVEIGAVDSPGDAAYDDYGNLVWTIQDPEDGIPSHEKTVIYMDGHTDTVQALRERWHEVIGGGIDPYLGMTNPQKVDRAFLQGELGHLPPEAEWEHLVWGRGAADQLGGVVCQIVASKILRELRSEGSLRGVIVLSFATVTEEDNEGGGPMYLMRDVLPCAGAEMIPDIVLLTEGTGCPANGALGIYRGQRGRMQIEVEVTGKSCHGSMPWEGRNPLEYGAAIIAEAAHRNAQGHGFKSDPFLGPGSRTASFATLQTPSDCAVPERFTFCFDRRLTVGEDPDQALRDVDSMSSVIHAREAQLRIDVRAPVYGKPTWKGYRLGNSQIYSGWVTPEDHVGVSAAVEAYKEVCSPFVPEGSSSTKLQKKPRVSRWVFSTDGVGYPVPADAGLAVPEEKRWVTAGAFKHPSMIGIGPGFEQNTHKIGECVDTREIPPVIAFLARFPSTYRRLTTEHP